VTNAIYLEPNGHGGYDTKIGDYFKQVDGRDLLVVVSKTGSATSTPLTHDELQALRDGIDDVLRGGR
jgi:hypothetical protein